MAERNGQDGTVRVATMGDIHCSKTSRGALRPVFERVAEEADILALCGDLTDYGTTEEAEVLIGELQALGKLPTVAVLGNHDFESSQPEVVSRMLSDAGVTMLDGESCEIRGVGFAGAKGFGGGFGRGTLGAWGERAVKIFVQEAIDEALKLESALARLRTGPKIVVLHYAPIRATVENEPAEIFPYLGCSRLEEPLLRYPATAVVHGHAHNGTFEGKTQSGISVYNVSAPLLRKTFPDRPPFWIIEVETSSAPSADDTAKSGARSLLA